jgi:membrane protein DedA with SNARE-associated domain
MPFEDLNEWMSGENSLYAHIAVFASLILGGFGAPIPEDIPLLLSGLAASKGVVSLRGIFLTCYFGVVLADQLVYLMGYFFGPSLLELANRSKFFPGINEDKVEKIREGLRKRRFLYIFLGRHLFPLRSATFLTAGAVRVPFVEFLISDAFAALISVGVMVGLGYWLGEILSPEVIEKLTSQIHFYVTLAVILIAAVYLIKRFVFAKLFYKQQEGKEKS